MIVLGVDPGSHRVGYGLIEETNNALTFVAAGILPLTEPKEPHALLQIQRTLSCLVEKFKPTHLAIERLYMGKNKKTATRVAHARGVILSLGGLYGLQICEYSPNEVKLGVTGYGGADKRAVAKMVYTILAIPPLNIHDDATDALALAIIGTRHHLRAH